MTRTYFKSVDRGLGQGENRFKSGAYTTVFEHFESVFNPPRILADHWALSPPPAD